jgi:hypothetical protein
MSTDTVYVFETFDWHTRAIMFQRIKGPQNLAKIKARKHHASTHDVPASKVHVTFIEAIA